MSRTLFVAVILASVSIMSVGVFAQTQTYTSPPEVGVSGPSERVVVPYTIDTSTVGNWDTLSVGSDFVDITGAATGSVEVPLPTEEHPIVYVSLLKDDVTKSGGGEDALVLGRKDTLEFTAKNTAMTGLTQPLVLFMVTREETFLAYDMFPEHPRFAELVALYTKHKGLPHDTASLEEIGTLEGEILLDVMTHIRTQPRTR